MKNNYEMVMGYKGLPVKILVHSVNKMKTHWHDNLELILVLEGSVKIRLKDKIHIIKENEMFIINSREIHSVSKNNEENILLLLQIDVKHYSRYYYMFNNMRFKDDYFTLDENKEKARILRLHISNIIWSMNKKSDGYKFIIGSETLRIIYHMMRYAKKDEIPKVNLGLDDQLEKFKDILDYVDNNFQNKITLGDIAEKVYFSEAHLSRFFKEMMGVTFQQYLDYIRIDKAADLLLSTNQTITDIAYESGLSSTKSLNKLFKDHLYCTPSELRENYVTISGNLEENLIHQGVKNNSYLDVYRTDVFRNLFEELDMTNYNEKNFEYLYDLDETMKEISLSKESTGKEFKDYWRRLTTIGRAKEGLRSDVQAQLSEIQKEIGFDYIRFHGIFAEDMFIYNADSKGRVSYNWNYVDKLFDFFLNINLKPFVSLGFMPDEIKSSDETMFWWKANVSPPKDMKLWTDLVEGFTKHCINRYGIDEVKTWYFEVWNQPEMENIYWMGSREDYFNLYKETVLSIKNISKELKVGGPSINNIAVVEGSWLDDFLKFIKEEKLPLDHISIHIYPEIYDMSGLEDEINFKEYENNEEKLRDLINIKENAKYIYSDKFNSLDTLNTLEEKLDKNLKDKPERHITEWNASSNFGNYIHDTCFVSNYIVDNILKCMGKTDSMGYWAASDVMEEIKSEKKEFHGGFGLITSNGIKKPSYFAYYLLNKLGNEILAKEDEYIVTRKDDDIQILAYNYAYFDDLFLNGDNSALSYEKRDKIFEEKAINRFEINIKDISGYYKVTRYKLNKENGSAFDDWKDLGSPENMTEEEIDYLKSITKPKMTVEYVELDGNYKKKIHTKVHGIDLITLEKKFK